VGISAKPYGLVHTSSPLISANLLMISERSFDRLHERPAFCPKVIIMSRFWRKTKRNTEKLHYSSGVTLVRLALRWPDGSSKQTNWPLISRIADDFATRSCDRLRR
jgi:hypothetical protein